MRPFISDHGLAAFRAAGASARPDTAQRYRRVDTEAGGGKTVTTFEPDTTYTHDARLEPVTITDTETEDTILAFGEWLLALPLTAEADPGDQFLVTGEGWSRLIRVTGTPGPHTWETERVLRCTSRDLATVTP